MEGEAWLRNDLAVVAYLWDTEFESVEWSHWDRLAKIVTQSREADIEKRWREEHDRVEGGSKDVGM